MNSTDNKATCLEGLHLLIIEDDPVFSFQLTTYLESRAARVTAAPDGESGLALARNTHPDLVLTDLGLPGLQGNELLSCLVQEISVPLIVISARGSMSDVSSALRLGAADYLIKPVDDWSSLVRSIQDLVNPQDTLIQDFTGQFELELARTELAEHREYFAGNDLAASQLFQTLQTSNPVQHSGLRLNVTPVHGTWSSEVIDLKDKVAVLLCEFTMVGKDSAVAAAIIRHLLNEPYRDYQHEQEPLLLHPELVLGQLNQTLCEARLPGLVNAVYALFDRDGHALLSMAGTRPAKGGANEQIAREIGERQDPALAMLDSSRFNAYNIQLVNPEEHTQVTIDFVTDLGACIRLSVEMCD